MTMLSTLTSKGQVTIPQALRQRLGLVPGQAVEFDLSADATCITLRPTQSARELPQQGFGMVKVAGPHVPADWDAASLLKP
jgi:AbrB family looped-hinge helix DNA binding protein